MTKRVNALHLPGLNGLRAIAAIGVLLSHLSMALDIFNLKQWLGVEANGHPTGLQLGKYGVIIFFALSGFLITYLLLLEKDRRPIAVKKFYVRRILRIWPLYYFYLGLAFAVYAVFGFGFPNVLPYYLLYTANIPFILRTPLPYVEHYWSLAVEEQFYLFWPWIVRRLRTKAFTLVAGLIGLIIFIKLFLHFVMKNDFSEILIDTFPFHCMMIGGAGAVLYKQQNTNFLKLTDNRLAQTLAWLALAAVAVNRFHLASVLDTEIIACVTVVIIVGQINRRHRLVNLELRGFDFIGKISYGLYIYHPLLIFLLSKLLGPLAMPAPAKYAVVYTAVIVCTVLVSYLSYSYFEKLFSQLKRKVYGGQNQRQSPRDHPIFATRTANLLTQKAPCFKQGAFLSVSINGSYTVSNRVVLIVLIDCEWRIVHCRLVSFPRIKRFGNPVVHVHQMRTAGGIFIGR